MVPENRLLRAQARETLKGRWGQAILVMFIYMVVISIWSMPGGVKGDEEPFNVVIDGLFPLISFIISGPLAFGVAHFFLSFTRNEESELSQLFDGFKQFSRTFILYFLMTLFTCLWMLLLIVPGIIAAIRYSQSFYILCENPDMSPSQAIKESMRLMNGHKKQFFFLGLSYIGWFLLGCITFGIGLLWVMPYYQTAATIFYQKIIEADKAA